MSAPIVFFDIAGPDSKKLKDFYTTLFGWDITDNGKFTTQVVSPLEATIRQDPAEMRTYIGVGDVAAKLHEIEAHEYVCAKRLYFTMRIDDLKINHSLLAVAINRNAG